MQQTPNKPVYDDSIADSYDSDRQSEEHWGLEKRFIEEYFYNMEFASLLDVPIGTGRLLENYSKNTLVTGVDISQLMLRKAEMAGEKLALGNLRLLIANVEKLPFRAKSHEVTVCCRLFHLLDNSSRPNALRELARVTAQRIVLQAYISPESKNSALNSRKGTQWVIRTFIRPIWQLLRAKRPWSHIVSYPTTLKEIEDLALRCRLRILDVRTLCKYGHLDVVFIVFEVPNSV